MGKDLFRPSVDRSDEAFVAFILQKQHLYFGPFPLERMGITDDDTLDLLRSIMQFTKESGVFSREVSEMITKNDIEFIHKIMKLSPGDRPSARELLQDPWFDAAQDGVS